MIHEVIMLLCICAVALSGAMLYAILEKIAYLRSVMHLLECLK